MSRNIGNKQKQLHWWTEIFFYYIFFILQKLESRLNQVVKSTGSGIGYISDKASPAINY